MTAFETPVALFVFNRPEQTSRVFARIAAERPRRLLVVADGPRPERAGEAELCQAARAVTEAVNWPCAVEREYSPVNLGCRARMSSGLDWVFSVCEAAIILEDDCLPEPTFFHFCDELLRRYAPVDEVGMISGDRFLPRERGSESYSFSRYAHVWGWATWRRSWSHYDLTMQAWPELQRSGWLAGLLGDSPACTLWTRLFDDAHAGRIDTWDYQWVFSCWARGALAVMPSVNLVSNIGFAPDATHTRQITAQAALPTEPMRFPLAHPAAVERDVRQDACASAEVFGASERVPGAGWVERIRERAERVPPAVRRGVARLRGA